MKKIYLIPYCHPDWAWTFKRRWHEKRYVLVIDEVLDEIKKNPNLRWYMDTFVTEFEPFLRFKPERYKELKERVKEGKIGICGTFTNLRPSMVGEETQIRDIIIGKKYFKKFFPEADLSVFANTVDVSVGHPQVPQILKLGNYKYLRFWRPHQPLSLKNIPLEFYWVGIDGSKILCSRGCYGGFNYIENIFENFEKEILAENNLSPTGIRWVSIGADDSRFLRTSYKDEKIPVLKFIKEWEKKKNIPIQFGTPIEYFKEVEKGKLEEIRGSLDVCEVCYNVGFGGKNGLFYLRSENEINLTESEKWYAITRIYGYDKKVNFEELWKKHLISCAHATQWLFEEDFNEIYEKTYSVKIECKRIKKDCLMFLRDIIKKDKNTELIIFNPLPYEIKNRIFVDISFPKSVEEFYILDGRKDIIPFQIIDKNEKAERTWEYKVVMKAKLPPLGFNTISIMKGKRDIKFERIDFKVGFEGANIVKIKTNDFELNTDKDNSFGDIEFYRVDTAKGGLHIGPIIGKERVKWEKIEEKEDGKIYKKIETYGNVGKQRLKREIIIYKDEPRIEFNIEILSEKEDGFLTFEFPKVFRGKIYGDTPFCVEYKDIENEIYSEEILERQRKGLFFAKSFVNFTNSDKSITYLNYDATHYYIEFERSIGNILLNSFTYRTGWERFMNKIIFAEGLHNFNSHLIFHKGDWKSFNIPKISQSLIRKPEILYIDSTKEQNLPPFYSFLSIKPDNLVLTGFYKENNFYILRFYETKGEKTEAEITLPLKIKSASKINFLAKKMNSKLKIENKKIKLIVNPWEIVSIKLKFY